ncbi:MAG: SpoIIE family protein phosphatase [Terracidiphilus sp.]
MNRPPFAVLRLHFVSIALLVLVLGGPCSFAQSFDARNLSQPAKLDVKWLVATGDDPAYARQDFDDSHWVLFDPNTPITRLYPEQPPILWYRLHVTVTPKQAGLALDESDISRAFEIYVNGEPLIRSGQVAPFVPYTLTANLRARIPERLLAAGSVVIAMRVHVAKSEWRGQYPGFYSSNLVLGQDEVLYREDWLSAIGEHGLDWLDSIFRIALGLVALVLFAAQRRQTEYLWITAIGALTLAELPVPVISSFHNIPVSWSILTILFRVVSPYIWGSLYLTFVHQRIGWRWRTFFVAAGLLNVLSGLVDQAFLALPIVFEFLSNLPFIILLSVIVPIVLIVHWGRGNREAGILLVPVVLFSFYIYAEVGFDALFQFPASRAVALRGLNLIDRYPAGPFAVSLDHISGILSTLSLAIIMLLRSTRMSRRQAQLENELAAAQQVQQLLLPEKSDTVPGYHVESIYQPAQEVGGDFFQILCIGDGGLLVVVGDVAGKGLPAAMLVSVLVGAIRGVAEYTIDPAEMLSNLNDRLAGRAGEGFTTALAARIAGDGRVLVANAGHLAPYLNGREIELAGALPLGVTSGARYQATEFRMAPGDRLTFYSDGVVEAQSAAGELFGFERAREISAEPAAAIVEAAKQFGQQDDITVVTIERAAAVASAA